MRQVFPGVLALDDQRIATPNLAPGVRVYDEDLFNIDGVEYRSWNPMRSKIGSYIVKGGRNFPLQRDSKVVYLGAANGTTPSHISDIVSDGVLVAVEFSPRSFRDLLGVAKNRPNMLPILADAWRPELYERYVGKVDLVFQDIAQRQQAAIFAKNLMRFKPAWGIIAVKARSVNVAAQPRDVYDQVCADIEQLTNYRVMEVVDLGPFEKDHAAVVVRPGDGSSPQRRDERASQRDDRPPRRDERPRDDRPPPRQWQERPPRDAPPAKPRFEQRPPPPPREGGFTKQPYEKKDRPAGTNKRGWR